MILIPARLASSRFPRKILQEIAGVPMIIRVAKRALEVDEVVVACDSEEVMELCAHHKIRSLLTSKSHQSGTDRIAEAARILGLANDEIIINLQGDEPFIEADVIRALQKSMQEAQKSSHPPFMASLYRLITREESQDPNLVKVVLSHDSRALYFSRASIPYLRDSLGEDKIEYYGHLGLYAYTQASLQHFCTLAPSMLEISEKLEQLRALSNGKDILMTRVQTRSFGIDTPQDLSRALEVFRKA